MPESLLLQYHFRKTANIKHAHPAMNANPPIGVNAPSQRMPVILRMYKLPEKTAMPPMKHHPAAVVKKFCHCDIAQATIIKPIP